MGVSATLPDAAAFEFATRIAWKDAETNGSTFVDIESGALHKKLGGYPGRSHRMPDCCQVMKRLMTKEDRILSEPAKGKGATLVIRYVIPR